MLFVRTNLKVLRDDVFIALKLSIGRQVFFLNLHHLDPIDSDLNPFVGFVMRFGPAPFLFSTNRIPNKSFF